MLNFKIISYFVFFFLLCCGHSCIACYFLCIFFFCFLHGVACSLFTEDVGFAIFFFFSLFSLFLKKNYLLMLPFLFLSARKSIDISMFMDFWYCLMKDAS